MPLPCFQEWLTKQKIQYIRQMQTDIQRTGSRKEIIKWVNSILELKVTSVEQLGTGAVYCQLLDIIRPGTVPMSKVNWKAKLEYQYISNYKVLQSAIQHLGIDLKLDVEKLIKCKYQDNFQMIQLLKKLIEKHGVPSDYNPPSRRSSNPELPEKKLSVLNKENILRKSGSITCFPQTTKASQAKIIDFTSNTPNQTKRINQSLKTETKVTSFIPNKQKSDEEKLRLIKQILQGKEENQLYNIKNIVFDNEDSEVDSEQELDVL